MSFSPPLFPELAVEDGSDTYSTGILPSQQIRCLIDRRHLTANSPIEANQVQPASIDLRLGPTAYRVRASFLPNRSSVRRRLDEFGFHEIDPTTSTALERGAVYIVPLLEEVSLPEQHWAKANPKSTTGRLDVLTRLITDFGKQFDEFGNSWTAQADFGDLGPK